MARKILVEREVMGGSIAYQAKTKDRVRAKLEKQLQSPKIQSVEQIFEDREDGEFIMTAVVQVADSEEK